MAVTSRKTTVAAETKKRPVLYLVTQMNLKSGDTVTRKNPIWENNIENDNLMVAVLDLVKKADDHKFQPNGQTYWYEEVPESAGISAADLL